MTRRSRRPSVPERVKPRSGDRRRPFGFNTIEASWPSPAVFRAINIRKERAIAPVNP